MRENMFTPHERGLCVSFYTWKMARISRVFSIWTVLSHSIFVESTPDKCDSEQKQRNGVKKKDGGMNKSGPGLNCLGPVFLSTLPQDDMLKGHWKETADTAWC